MIGNSGVFVSPFQSLYLELLVAGVVVVVFLLPSNPKPWTLNGYL